MRRRLRRRSQEVRAWQAPPSAPPARRTRVLADAVRRVWLLFRKDLRILRRSPALAVILVAYPLVIAALVGLVAGYANAKPRVALVDEDGLPPVIVLAGHSFHVDRTISET